MNQILAEVGGADFQISGNWLIAFAVAVIPLIGGVWLKAKQAGRAEATDNNVTLKKPVPTIQTRVEPQWASKPELNDFIDRADRQFGEVWEAIQAERGIARTALSRIHERIDAQSNATAKLQGSMDEVKGTLGRLLDIALNRKPPGTR